MGLRTEGVGLLAPRDLAFVDVRREPLWSVGRWVSSHECGVARRQRRLGIHVAMDGDRGVVAEFDGGGAVRLASAAGGISGMGDRTQGCAQRLLRLARAAGL